MRFLWNLIKLAVLIAALGFFLKAYGAKWLLTVYLQKELGARVSIEEVKLDFVNTQAKFGRVVVQNPLVYPEGGMIYIPKLFVDFEPRALLDRKVLLTTVDVTVEEIRVLNASGNGVNLNALTVLKPKYRATGEEAAARYEVDRKPDFHADQLVLTLDRGTYTDLTGVNPVQKSHELRLQHAVFKDVEGLRGVMEILVRETLKRMGVSA